MLFSCVIPKTSPLLRVAYPRGSRLNSINITRFKMASTLSLPDSRVLNYALDKSPENAPIVLLSNSLCAPLNGWDHVVPVLNKRGFRTLRYDQPGHGGSSAPKNLDTTFESIADDVNHLLKHLQIPKLHGWIGVSMGAATGIIFAAKYPGLVSKMAICDTISSSPINAGVEDLFGQRVAAAREAGNLDAITQGTLERWFGKEWLESNPEEAARMRSVMSGTTVDGFETCCHALRGKDFDLRPLFTKVGAGVDDALLVVGEKDANLPETMEEMRVKVEEGFKAAGKDKKIDLVLIQNAGHVCFIDGFDQFVSKVISWL